MKLAALLVFCIIGVRAAADPLFIAPSHDCKQPVVAADGRRLAVAWVDQRDGKPNIYVRVSGDEGASWSADMRLSMGTTSFCYPAALLAENGRIHAAWIDYGDALDGALWYARSTDGGSTWEPSRVLLPDADGSRYPLLRSTGSIVVLVYQNVKNSIYCMVSDNAGTTWSAPQLLTTLVMHSCYCHPPALEIRGSRIVMVYADMDTQRKIATLHARLSDDLGRTWWSPRLLESFRVEVADPEELANPIFAAYGESSYLALFWVDKRRYKLGEVYRSNSVDSGHSWTRGVSVFRERASPRRPSACEGVDGTLHLVFAAGLAGTTTVRYLRGSGHGARWEPARELSSGSGRFADPCIARSGSGRLHVVWADESHRWSRIYYRISDDDGRTWRDWDVVATTRPGDGMVVP